MADWFEETFGRCPHDGIKPYCPQCAGAELAKKTAERRQEREQRSEAKLKETVVRQSLALDNAYSHVRALERRLRSRSEPQTQKGRLWNRKK
jgi:uncharacterized Zn finger protein (UPF0148 family)